MDQVARKGLLGCSKVCGSAMTYSSLENTYSRDPHTQEHTKHSSQDERRRGHSARPTLTQQKAQLKTHTSDQKHDVAEISTFPRVGNVVAMPHGAGRKLST